MPPLGMTGVRYKPGESLTLSMIPGHVVKYIMTEKTNYLCFLILVKLLYLCLSKFNIFTSTPHSLPQMNRLFFSNVRIFKKKF